MFFFMCKTYKDCSGVVHSIDMNDNFKYQPHVVEHDKDSPMSPLTGDKRGLRVTAQTTAAPSPWPRHRQSRPPQVRADGEDGGGLAFCPGVGRCCMRFGGWLPACIGGHFSAAATRSGGPRPDQQCDGPLRLVSGIVGWIWSELDMIWLEAAWRSDSGSAAMMKANTRALPSGEGLILGGVGGGLGAGSVRQRMLRKWWGSHRCREGWWRGRGRCVSMWMEGDGAGAHGLSWWLVVGPLRVIAR